MIYCSDITRTERYQDSGVSRVAVAVAAAAAAAATAVAALAAAALFFLKRKQCTTYVNRETTYVNQYALISLLVVTREAEGSSDWQQNVWKVFVKVNYLSNASTPVRYQALTESGNNLVDVMLC